MNRHEPYADLKKQIKLLREDVYKKSNITYVNAQDIIVMIMIHFELADFNELIIRHERKFTEPKFMIMYLCWKYLNISHVVICSMLGIRLSNFLHHKECIEGRLSVEKPFYNLMMGFEKQIQELGLKRKINGK
jgi:hypothetical protein